MSISRRTNPRMSEEREAYIGNAHLAICRYTVEFSELVREMRHMIAQHIARGGEKWALANIALGESSAMEISHAFSGLCRDAAHFTKEEEKVAMVLEREV